jgi:hypothetical protein
VSLYIKHIKGYNNKYLQMAEGKMVEGKMVEGKMVEGKM